MNSHHPRASAPATGISTFKRQIHTDTPSIHTDSHSLITTRDNKGLRISHVGFTLSGLWMYIAGDRAMGRAFSTAQLLQPNEDAKPDQRPVARTPTTRETQEQHTSKHGHHSTYHTLYPLTGHTENKLAVSHTNLYIQNTH